jgi:hypothetical protein
MAITKLAKSGFGQLEPNHLSAQRTGQVFAQLPVNVADLTTLGGRVENGLFLDYNYGIGGVSEVALPEAGGSKLTMLVFNEVRLYADFLTNKDFALFPSGAATNIGIAPEAQYPTSSTIVSTVFPRLYKPEVGDIITTNLVAAEGTGVIGDYAVGNVLTPGADGVLVVIDTVTTETLLYRVAAITTTPDLQPALKLQCIQA